MSATTNLLEILDRQPTASVLETAEMLSVSRQAVYAMASDGRLDALRIGRRVVIKTDSIRRLLGES
jgi:excisionase family DNA binding protein